MTSIYYEKEIYFICMLLFKPPSLVFFVLARILYVLNKFHFSFVKKNITKIWDMLDLTIFLMIFWKLVITMTSKNCQLISGIFLF